MRDCWYNVHTGIGVLFVLCVRACRIIVGRRELHVTGNAYKYEPLRFIVIKERISIMIDLLSLKCEEEEDMK